jgi:uncharacterized membrane protein YbhN (UPF0104 family)
VKQRLIFGLSGCGRGLRLLLKQPLFWTLVKYGLGIGLLALVVWQYWSYPSPDGSGQMLGLKYALDKPVSTGPFVLALVIGSVSILITFVRWFILVRALDLPFTLWNALRLGMIGYYLSTFLPGSVGGDIIKATYIAREQSRRTAAVASVLIDRAIGLLGLIWLVALIGGTFWATGYLEDIVISAAAARTLQVIVSIALGCLVGSLLFWFLLGVLPNHRAERFAGRLTRIPKVGHSLAEFWRAVWMYRCRGRSVGLALLLSLVGHVGFVSTFYFAARTLHRADEIPSLEAHFLIVPVGMSIQAGFPAPGGVGGGEIAYGELYKQVSYPFDRGVLGSLVKRVTDWILGLTGYLVYLQMRPALRVAREKSDRPPTPSTNGFSAAGHPPEPVAGIPHSQPPPLREEPDPCGPGNR